MERPTAVEHDGDVLIPASEYWATVSPAYGWLKELRWHVHVSANGNTAYACHSFSGTGGKTYHVMMHHFVLPSLPKGSGIDVHHLDGNGLNNRRENLVYLRHGENVRLGHEARRRRARALNIG